MNLSARGEAIFREKSYCLSDDQTFDDRVCQIVDTICYDWDERRRKRFKELIIDAHLFSFGGRIWFATNRHGMVMNCFTEPIRDSMESIYGTLERYALILKKGGGVGINFSEIRPKGSPIYHGLESNNCKATEFASGPVSFMKNFQAAAQTIAAGGARKGATMAILNWSHPDILEFMEAKCKRGEFDMFNFSVMFDDTFFEYYKEGDLKAREIWRVFVDNCYEHGEPGFLNRSRLNDANFHGVEIEATNPCGEEGLIPYGACALSSINLAALPSVYSNAFHKEFEEIITLGETFLWNVINICVYPFPENEETAFEGTKALLSFGGGVQKTS